MTAPFTPFFTPQQMLEIGVFDGGYFNESPEDMKGMIVAGENFYAPKVGASRWEWQSRGWIDERDPLGWFQWYMRYFNGRRLPEYDHWQIGRWSSFGARHGAQVLKNGNGDMTKRLRQRQGLLHWAHNPEPDRKQ
jgi:hypothetical protein